MENMTNLDIDLEGIKNFKFNRVDFNDSLSILNYGNDVIEIIENIVVALDQAMHIGDTSKINFLEDIENLNAFDDELKKLETKDNKQKHNGIIQQLVEAILEKLPISTHDEKVEDKIDTYADLYTKHCENIDILSQKIYEEQTNVKNAMMTNNELLNLLDSIIKLLGKVIEEGENDKNAYKNTLANLSNNPSNAREINRMKQNIEIFERKLISLKETIMTTSLQYDKLLPKNTINMEILLQYDNFVKITAPSLKLQTHDIIGTKQQADRLNSIEQLSKAVNQNMLKSSTMLGENIAKAQEMGSHGFIDVKTLITLKDNTFKAIESLQNYQSTIAKKRDENDKTVNGIIKELSLVKAKQPNLLTIKDDIENSVVDVITEEEPSNQFVKRNK